jgi:hypothetical protein
MRMVGWVSRYQLEQQAAALAKEVSQLRIEGEQKVFLTESTGEALPRLLKCTVHSSGLGVRLVVLLTIPASSLQTVLDASDCRRMPHLFNLRVLWHPAHGAANTNCMLYAQPHSCDALLFPDPCVQSSSP